MPADWAPSLDRPDSALVDRLRPSPQSRRAPGWRLAVADPAALHRHARRRGRLAWLCDPRSQVSCHYVVDEAGGILQLVAEDRRAWHAGRSSWAGETDINTASIGIEIVNPGHAGGLPPYPDRQVEAVIRLCADIAVRRDIRPEGVLAHSDVAPGRKQDPGERFPWDLLYERGVGLWVPPKLEGAGCSFGPGEAGEEIAAVQADLAAYGYGVVVTGQVDAVTEAVVRSFQLHFRPSRADGILDPGSRDTLKALLARRAAGDLKGGARLGIQVNAHFNPRI